MKVIIRSTTLILASFVLTLIVNVGGPIQVASADHLSLSISGTTVELDGEILIEGQDKSLYFLESNGKIWFVKPDQIKKRTDEEKATPSSTKNRLDSSF